MRLEPFASLLTKQRLYLIFSTLLVANVVWHSFIEEDAFITFRVVDNFVHGYGLRWNINERVQTYTNPLWMFLHIPVYYVLNNIIWTTLIISWACVAVLLLIVYRTFSEMPLVRLLVLFILPVALSPIHTMFFTSGLENVLLSLLFIAIGYYLVRYQEPPWLAVSLLISLSAVTRLDTLLFYAPLAIAALLHYRTQIRWSSIMLGASPLAGWLLFSLFYYGFFTPNTSWAKLGTGLTAIQYIRFGLLYCLDTIIGAPWDALMMITAMLYFPGLLLLSKQRSYENVMAAAIALGIALYTMYVIRIGGYQLSFRMFSLPAIAACWLWLWRLPPIDWRVAVPLIIAMVLASAWAKTPQERQAVSLISGHHISGTPWAIYLFTPNGPHWYDVHLPKKIAPERHRRKKREIIIGQSMGQPLFASSRRTLAIDVMGLCDPLIARLPSTQPFFSTGHNRRDIPKGYVKAFVKGDTSEMHPALGQYYYLLQLITRGDLWDMERLKTIIRFNLGYYEPLREQYIREAYYTPQH